MNGLIRYSSCLLHFQAVVVAVASTRPHPALLSAVHLRTNRVVDDFIISRNTRLFFKSVA